MTTTTFTVQGMTCGHCVAAVRQELGRLRGVTDVDVVLESGAVSLTSDAPISADDIDAAVEEAGYTVTGH
jgi:copper ion binding protein